MKNGERSELETKKAHHPLTSVGCASAVTPKQNTKAVTPKNAHFLVRSRLRIMVLANLKEEKNESINE
jgi:hypothetical protein